MELAMQSREVWEVVDPCSGDFVKGCAKYQNVRQALALCTVMPQNMM
jgi:hypothetical protein